MDRGDTQSDVETNAGLYLAFLFAASLGGLFYVAGHEHLAGAVAIAWIGFLYNRGDDGE